MKLNLFAIVATLIMMMVTTSVMGQSKEEIWRTKKAENEARKQQLRNRIGDQIVNGIDKTKDQIMDSKPEDGTLYQLRINQEKSQRIEDIDATPEQLRESSEFVITEGKDYVITSEGNVKLTSYHGYQVKTTKFFNAIRDYNNGLEKFQKVRQECVELNREYTNMLNNRGDYGQRDVDEKKLQLENKLGEKETINKNTIVLHDEALRNGEVIRNSTSDPTLLKAVNGFVYDLENFNEVDGDYKNLMEYLEGCSDCGKR